MSAHSAQAQVFTRVVLRHGCASRLDRARARFGGLHGHAEFIHAFSEPVYDLKWLTLGRNRDEWVAHGAPHGLVPMQATGMPN
ncbi:MAG: hypothetical protein LBV61_07375, partial [Burkholderiaceae bacterium]|nr:hypothetical protein [Burkholderiaceae bacterium]